MLYPSSASSLTAAIYPKTGLVNKDHEMDNYEESGNDPNCRVVEAPDMNINSSDMFLLFAHIKGFRIRK